MVLTTEGPQWMGDDAYKRKLLAQFEADPFFFAVSFRHWFTKANRDLANFKKVKKFRRKVGFELVCV